MTFFPIVPGTGVAGFNYLTRTRDVQEQALAQSALASRDISAVRERLEQVQTVDDLLSDRTVLRVVLSSFGLEEDVDNTGFLRRVLNSDANNGASFANRLADPRYGELARVFNFAGQGGPSLPGADPVDAVAPRLSQLSSVDALFEPQNETLLERALEVFDLGADAGRETFLKSVLRSDLSDPQSLANRLGDQRYIDFVAAFSNTEDRVPEVLRGQVSDRVAEQLRSLTSAEDLVSDRRLLRSVLTQFGLEDMTNNTFFLQSVLTSDLNDPRSVANTASNPALRELASAFDFAARAQEQSSIYGFASLAASRPSSLSSADALLDDAQLRDAALKLFGLEGDTNDRTFLKSVLESDLTDSASVANAQDDPRYRALSEVFDFGRQLASPDETRRTRLDRLVDAVEARNAPPTTPDDLINDVGLFLAVTNFFDLPQGAAESDRTRRALRSDLSDPLSSANLASDPRYLLAIEAANFQPAQEGRLYPPGFVDQIVDDYLERQFEVAVGNVDNSMRVSLGFEREFSGIVAGGSTNDARWLGVMGSPSVRLVFEAAFGFPPSFGQIDVNQQLEGFKARAQSTFGTDDVQTLLAPENVAELQRRYLARETVVAGGDTGAQNLVSLLLNGG